MEFFNSIAHWIAAAIIGAASMIVLALTSVTPLTVVQPPAPASTTNTTTAQISTTTVKTVAPSTVKTATTTKKVSIPVVKPVTATSTPQTSTVVQSTPPTPVDITNEDIARTNTIARASVVNIFCTLRTPSGASYISGSGIVIDSRGVVLTNSHIAQYFLLQNTGTSVNSSCIIRTGSPATPAYNATLLFLPPSWINANASQILSDNATGTGENDYAFLLITGPTQFAAPLPSAFSALTYSTVNPKVNEPILLAAYPAGFLDSNSVQRSLYSTSAVSKIQTVYTFESAYNIDVISLGGTAVAQGGSSGGAVIDLANGLLIGLISTESDGATTAERDLRAITLAYINRSLQAKGLGGISALLEGSLSQTAAEYNKSIAPALTQKLLDAINK